MIRSALWLLGVVGVGPFVIGSAILSSGDLVAERSLFNALDALDVGSIALIGVSQFMANGRKP